MSPEAERRRALAAVAGEAAIRAMPGGALLVEPDGVEAVSRIVALAHERGWSVLPRGGGTASGRAAGGGRPDIVVSTARLDRLSRHDPDEMIATAECGIRFRELQRRLGERGQFLPLDPPLPEAATLGGVLATNAFGPRRLRYGTARDAVLGTELVRFDGKLVHAGGRVVKNVSGYDLSKLYVGAWGSLGILVRVHLKLAPRPPAGGLLRVGPLPREAAGRLAARLLGRPLPLAAAVFRAPAPSSDGELLLLLEGLPELIDRQTDAAAEWLRQEGAPEPERVAGGTAARRALDAAMNDLVDPPPALRIRLSYPPAAFAPLGDRLAGVTLGRPAELSLVGSGVTWLTWREPPEQEPERLLEELGAIAAAREGWAMVEHRPPERPWRGRVVVPPPESLELMRSLRKALDPDGTFPDPPFLEGA